MIDLSKQFPERVHFLSEFRRLGNALEKSQDPFGGALDALGKTVHHHFENGHRVRVNSPGHHTHGSVGVIADDRDDRRLEVKLDSGHVIHCAETDLVPEDFPLAGGGASDKIRKGPSHIRIGDRVRVRSSGKEGRVTRFSHPDDAAHDLVDHVLVIMDGDVLGVGVDFSLDELEMADAGDTMLLPGSIRVAEEARQHQEIARAFDPLPVDGVALAKGSKEPDPVPYVAELLKAGKTVVFPRRLRAICEGHEPLRKLIANGQIQFGLDQ